MAEYTIDKIEYGGNVYKLQDNVSGYTTSDSDEKLAVGGITSGSTYYPIVGSGTAAATRQIDSTGFSYDATTSTTGYARITLGNSTAQPTSGSKYGALRLYGTTANSTTIVSGAPTAIRTITLPDKTGTVALTSDIVDEKIKLTLQSTSGTYPLIFGPTSITTNSTYQGYYNTGITVNPNTKTVTATTFVGALTGTASGNLTSSSTLDATKLSGTIPSSCYTNTTYGISGSLSNHVFTSTLTAGGSGTTSVLTLAAGTGITLTDDTTNKKITIACSVTNTDTKVSTAAITSEVSYYPVLGSDTTEAATKFYDKTGFGYTSRVGTTSTEGTAVIALGNNISTGTAGNKSGRLLLYGKNNYTASILTADLTAHTTIKFPNKSGTIALTSDITDTKVSTAAVTSGITYYPVLGSDTTSAATKFYDNSGISYVGTNAGASSYNSSAMLILGNDTAYPNANNKKGCIRMYGPGSTYADIVNSNSSNYNNGRILALPSVGGTLAITDDIPYVNTLWVYEDEDNPGTYIGPTAWEVQDIYNRWVSNGNSIITCEIQPIDYHLRYCLTDIYSEDIIDEYDSVLYQIMWFSGTISKRNASGNLQETKRITCGFPIDPDELHYSSGTVFMDIREIGERYTINGGDTGYTTNISTTADQFKQLAVLNLPAGRWVVTARARFTPTSSSNHYSAINIGTATAGSGSTTTGNAIRDRRYGEGTYFNQHSLSRIIAFDVATPVYLNGGGSNVAGTWTRNSDVFQFDAIRIR